MQRCQRGGRLLFLRYLQTFLRAGWLRFVVWRCRIEYDIASTGSHVRRGRKSRELRRGCEARPRRLAHERSAARLLHIYAHASVACDFSSPLFLSPTRIATKAKAWGEFQAWEFFQFSIRFYRSRRGGFLFDFRSENYTFEET